MDNGKKNDDFLDELIGKPVMIRTYSAGVHYGTLSKYTSNGSEYSVKLVKAKRVWSWTGACSLSQLATEGSKLTDSRISVEVPSIFLKAIEVIEMTDFAVNNLNNIKTWKIE